jgi:hypothetical protein
MDVPLGPISFNASDNMAPRSNGVRRRQGRACNGKERGKLARGRNEMEGKGREGKERDNTDSVVPLPRVAGACAMSLARGGHSGYGTPTTDVARVGPRLS